MSETIKVTSLEGLYDEDAKAELHHINKRRICLRNHEFINASLYWESKHKPDGSYFFIDLKNKGGYGEMRFCIKCKVIDCIHIWEYQTTYEIERGLYYSEKTVIGKCKVCGRRIRLSGCGDCHPKLEALAIIHEEGLKLDKDVNTYPSGWHIELPVTISQILDISGEETARAYARESFIQGRILEGRNISYQGSY